MWHDSHASLRGGVAEWWSCGALVGGAGEPGARALASTDQPAGPGEPRCRLIADPLLHERRQGEGFPRTTSARSRQEAGQPRETGSRAPGGRRSFPQAARVTNAGEMWDQIWGRATCWHLIGHSSTGPEPPRQLLTMQILPHPSTPSFTAKQDSGKLQFTAGVHMSHSLLVGFLCNLGLARVLACC